MSTFFYAIDVRDVDSMAVIRAKTLLQLRRRNESWCFHIDSPGGNFKNEMETIFSTIYWCLWLLSGKCSCQSTSELVSNIEESMENSANGSTITSL